MSFWSDFANSNAQKRVVSFLSGWMPAPDDSIAFLRHLHKVADPTSDPNRVRQLLQELATHHNDPAMVRQVLEDFGRDTGNTLEAVVKATLRFHDQAGTPDLHIALRSLMTLKQQNGQTVVGSIVPELDQSLTRFFQRERDLSRFDGDVEGLLEHWANSTRRGGRPRAMLELIAGKAMNLAGPVTRSSQSGRFWHNFFPRPDPTPIPLRELLDFVKDEAGLHARISQIWQMRYAGVDGAPTEAMLRERIEAYLHLHVKSDNTVSWASRDTLDKMSEADLRGLIGNQQLDEAELIHRLCDGYDIMEQVAKAQGLPGLEPLWFEIPGTHALFSKVVTRSGHQKAYVFELEVTIDALRRSQLPGSTIDEIVVQVRIGFAEGPDLAIIEQGVAFFVQAKSWQRVGDLLGAGGEMVRQSGSDLRRIWYELRDEWLASGRITARIPRQDGLGNVAEELTPVGTILRYVVDTANLSPAKNAALAANGAEMTGDWLQNVIHNALLAVDELNGLLASTRTLTEAPELVDIILDGSNRGFRVGGDLIPTPGGMRGRLEALVQANPDITIRELMLIRMVMDKSGGFDQELVDFLKAIEPPLTFELHFRDPNAFDLTQPFDMDAYVRGELP